MTHPVYRSWVPQAEDQDWIDDVIVNEYITPDEVIVALAQHRHTYRLHPRDRPSFEQVLYSEDPYAIWWPATSEPVIPPRADELRIYRAAPAIRQDPPVSITTVPDAPPSSPPSDSVQSGNSEPSPVPPSDPAQRGDDEPEPQPPHGMGHTNDLVQRWYAAASPLIRVLPPTPIAAAFLLQSEQFPEGAQRTSFLQSVDNFLHSDVTYPPLVDEVFRDTRAFIRAVVNGSQVPPPPPLPTTAVHTPPPAAPGSAPGQPPVPSGLDSDNT